MSNPVPTAPVSVASPRSLHTAAAGAIVHDHAGLAVVATLVPVPFVEFVAVSAVHLNMLEKLSGEYRVAFSRARAKAVVGALVSGFASQSLGTLLAASFANFVPGLGLVVASIARPSVAGALTYALGHAFIAHFERGGSLLDVDYALMRTEIWRDFAHRRTDPAELARVVGQ